MTIKEVTFLVPCTEPGCSQYDIGHLEPESWVSPDGAQIIHQASVAGETPVWIIVQKFADQPWEVEFEGNSSFPTADPDTADRIAAAIVAAAAKCRELNA